MITLDHVSVGYGATKVIHGISLGLARGEFLSIIGPNGAGKTTLIGAISGALPIASGRITFGNEDVTTWPVGRRARAGIGRSFQKTNLFPHLTAIDNVKLAIQARAHIGARHIFASVHDEVVDAASKQLQRVGLEKHGLQAAAVLSHGDKRRLELAMLLATDPQVLLLDEPTAGMSLAEAPGILDLIGELKSSGDYSIILVEHKLPIVMQLSDRIAVLHQGSLLTQGTPDSVMADPEVERAYLGGNHELSS